MVTKFDKDNSKVNFILESLGYLPKNYKGDWLFKFTQHENYKVRMSAIKNIGKLKLNGEIEILYKLFTTETRTEIKREIISSIGRQRNIESKDFLIATLKDKDPKIVSQAIRALLVFKGNIEITNELKKLRNHKNEMIQSVIEKEFFSKNSSDSTLHHTETFEFLKNTIVHGDVLEVLKSVPDESIHLTFTSPPYYNARDYSIYPSYQDYLFFLDEVFKAVHRVTKEGRFLLINTSPIIIPRISRQHSSKRYPIPFDLHHYIVNAGWEYIDDIIWLKPETSVKNRVGGFQQHRKPLGYKPNTVTEMIMVYRKQTTKLIDWNIRQYPKEIVEKSKVANGFETSNVWEIDPTYNRNHTAVFPVELCKKVIEYYSFKGDLVFDPFGGSGTFGRAAKSLNRLFFLTELNDDYFEYMKSTKKSNSLFNEYETKFLEIEEFNKIANDTN
ncbi:MAG: DNA methyltransferase [Saprospiraceae bacterium]